MPLRMERFRDALQVLNSMKDDGVIEDYAVARAMAILFWTEHEILARHGIKL
jgi:hypothetical protein